MSSSQHQTPQQIQAGIELTRQELGVTVAAVADKADVKKQARNKVDELKGQASAKVADLTGKAKGTAPDSAGNGVARAQRYAEENPVSVKLAGAFLGGLVVGRLTSRRARG
jgi:ElaB/YqjD/DUF883 family membrane-anchored ribosome-binding protein